MPVRTLLSCHGVESRGWDRIKTRLLPGTLSLAGDSQHQYDQILHNCIWKSIKHYTCGLNCVGSRSQVKPVANPIGGVLLLVLIRGGIVL